MSIAEYNSDTAAAQLQDYFCSDTAFNFSKNVLTKTEIRALEKGLDYNQIKNKINLAVISRNSSGECVLNGIFEMNLFLILLMCHHLHLNRH